FSLSLTTRHYRWGATASGTPTSCFFVSLASPQNRYSDGLKSRVASQYSAASPDHSERLTPCSSRYQLLQPPVFHTVVERSFCSFSLNRSCASRVGATACAPASSTAAIAWAA